ncbi:hypothetical protein AVEN_250300-1 [Araneus ventricosus]|uniref:Uncharacterized protein n=1 Tax=Araneus ventricosus TaxID=182803 RepID=A0A4Y2FMW5_ARAVE|nr:hypothetical protein AVEN_250300-1 [Araneus ventricosus]
MEYAKKLLLVPEERMQAVIHLSDLDQQMNGILKRKDLLESDKATLYVQILQNYIKIPQDDKSSEDHSEISPVLPLSSNTEPSIEENVNKTAPVSYRNITKNILEHLKKHKDILSWTPFGEIIFNDQLVEKTNISSLINNFLTNRKIHPPGVQIFHKALKNAKLPVIYDVNKKLYHEFKIGKPKVHQMYARRRSWMELKF